MGKFYKLPKGDVVYIAVLLCIAVVAFLPWARAVQWEGMAALGWLMAGLMVLSPAIALVRLWDRK